MAVELEAQGRDARSEPWPCWSALEPVSVARQPKAKPVVTFSSPKRLTFPDNVPGNVLEPSAIACVGRIAAAKCGCDHTKARWLPHADGSAGDGGHASLC